MSTSAIDLAWEEVVVVPLVRGRSFGREAHRHFKGAMWSDDDTLDREPWRLYPEPVPADVWDQLDLDCWPIDGWTASLNGLVSSYGTPFGHVDHLADLVGLAGGLDDLGTEILAGHTGAVATRLDQWSERTADAFAEVIDICHRTAAWQDHLDIASGAQILTDLGAYILPRPEGSSAVLTLDDVVAWRGRLSGGLGSLGIARLLLLADWLGLPALEGSADET